MKNINIFLFQELARLLYKASKAKLMDANIIEEVLRVPLSELQ